MKKIIEEFGTAIVWGIVGLSLSGVFFGLLHSLPY